MPESVPSATAIDKAITVYELLLFSKTEHSAQEISDMLNCSKSTVSRVLKQLEGRPGVVLRRRIDKGRELYSLAMPGKTPRTACTPKEVDSLKKAVTLASAKLGPERTTACRMVIDRLRLMCESLAREEVSDPALFREWRDYSDQADVARTIAEARRTGHVCTIEHKRNSRSRVWDIAPTRLICGDSVLYVEAVLASEARRYAAAREAAQRAADGMAPDENAPSAAEQEEGLQRYLFAIDSICSATLSDAGYFPPDDPEGEFPCSFLHGGSCKVKIRLLPKAAAWLKNRVVSPDQQVEPQPDGSILLSFSAGSEGDVVRWALSLGANAEILEPPSLRARMAEEARTLLTMHEDIPMGLPD